MRLRSRAREGGRALGGGRRCGGALERLQFAAGRRAAARAEPRVAPVQLPAGVAGAADAGLEQGDLLARRGEDGLERMGLGVQGRESLDLAPAPIPFSTTPTGLVEETVFTAATTTNVSLFVERNSAAGFYTIAILVTEI